MTVAENVAASKTTRKAYRALCAAITLLLPAIVLAFWKSYFGILNDLPEIITSTIHIHFTLMSVWVAMLVSQPWLIHSGRMRAHRMVGRASYAVVPLVIWFGLVTVREALARTPEGVAADAAQINIFGFGQLGALAVTWGLAIAYRKRTKLHMRYMISTVIAIAPAVVFRVLAFWVPGFGFDKVPLTAHATFAVMEVAAAVLVLNDWRLRLKRSPFWVILILSVLMHLSFFTVGTSGAWLTFCEWYVSLPTWLLF